MTGRISRQFKNEDGDFRSSTPRIFTRNINCLMTSRQDWKYWWIKAKAWKFVVNFKDVLLIDQHMKNVCWSMINSNLQQRSLQKSLTLFRIIFFTLAITCTYRNHVRLIILPAKQWTEQKDARPRQLI